MAEQHRAEGRQRLRVGEQRRIVDPLEPRLGDVVAVTEVDGVPVVQRPVEHADQFERVTGQARQRAALDVVERGHLIGVDRGDDVHAFGVAERLDPRLGRGLAEIAELDVARRHPLDERSRERLE